MAKKGRYIYEWPRPMVTVDAAVFRFLKNDIKILLIKRRHNPYKDCWALPGGFIEMDEELEDAAARELKEETGISGIKLEQLKTFGTVGRDPRGRQISVVFFGISKGKEIIKAGDDAAEAKWFSVKELPRKMGFDHREIIKEAQRSTRAQEHKSKEAQEKRVKRKG